MTDTVAFTALGCSFRVDTDLPGVAEYLGGLFRHLDRTDPAAAHRRYRVSRGGQSDVVVTGDGQPLNASRFAPPLRALLRDIDEHLIAHSPRLLLHASAAEYDGRALAFPALSGTGKSTLVAGLVGAGFGYLTDEFVAPDWDTAKVRPYHRAITIPPGSWTALPDLAPTVPEGLQPLLEGAWQIDPEDIRPGSPAEACRLGYVIFPRYQQGSATQLEPLGRAQALIDLVSCTFHFHDHGAKALELLADVITDCECYTLTMGSLDDACAVIMALVGAEAPAEVK